MAYYPSIAYMTDEQVQKADEYLNVFGLHDALYHAVLDAVDAVVVRYIHEAAGFDDEALEEAASDFDIDVDTIKQEFLLK